MLGKKGINSPFIPGNINSVIDVVFLAITGTLQAIASSTTSPNDSLFENIRQMSIFL